MPAKLKVYRAQMGFFESVVAAPSQKAALDAWGTRQNLFAEGLAAVTDDPDAARAALAAPGRPQRRPAGFGGAFEDAAAAPSRLPDPPKAAPRKAAKGKAKAAPAAPPPPPPPDRSALDAAEAVIRKLEADHKKALAEIARARRDLEDRAETAEREFGASRRSAERALKQAQRDYERALVRADRG
jgi:hypothetical protein